MDFSHRPVLCEELISVLNIDRDGIYLDATVGGGGHSSGICENLSEKGVLIGMDRDGEAVSAAAERLAEYACRKHFVQSNFEDVKLVLAGLRISKVNGAVLDLGVSSYQLDNPERGFSYMNDAPLDMRMNACDSFSAEDLVNEYSEEELARVIRNYGEERWAARIAEFIVSARERQRIRSTGQLVEIIKAAIPASARRTGPHPAKRSFQAIRIEVNDELGQLERSIDSFIDILAPGGRLAVISFHSLEDRIVKEAFSRRLNPCTCPSDFPVCSCGMTPDVVKVSSKAIIPSKEEEEKNPRSRSAKLRVIEKAAEERT